MHSELGSTNINGLDASLGSHHGSNCRSAKRIVSYDKVLNGNIDLMAHMSKNRCANGISHVTLVSISLNNDTFMNLRLMATLVLLSVVRVASMGHIS